MRLACALIVVLAAGVAWAGVGPSTTPRASCPATTVRYQAAKHPTLHDMPWVLARPTARGVLGFVVSYQQMLRDGRVNRSDRLVLWRTSARVVWSAGGTVVARRLDGPGSFRVALVQSADGFDYEPRFPSGGCWRLTLRTSTGSASVVARVIPGPKTLGCAATVLESGNAFVRPRSSGVRGGWPWQTRGPASLSTHGHAGDRNMKVLWSVRRNWGRLLELVGTRLDAAGSFRQEFSMAFDGVFPSTVDVPAAGCWLFRLRTGRLAGVLVVRAVDEGG